MYLHIGNNSLVKTGDIIGIFDLDNTTVMKSTRDYLSTAEKRGEVVNVTDELPKSFLVYSGKENDKKVYISQLAPSTLIKRLEKREF